MDHSPDIDSYALHYTVEGVQEDLKEPKLKIELTIKWEACQHQGKLGIFHLPQGSHDH